MTERWRRIGLLDLILVTVSRLTTTDDGRSVQKAAPICGLSGMS